MIVEFGHFCLILAMIVSAVQFLAPQIGDRISNPSLLAMARPAAISQTVLLLISFGALTAAYVTSDFSVANVYNNSHSDKPLIYLISGVWGNHEGSLLLWVLMLALFGCAVALFGQNLPDRLFAHVLSVQGSIGLAFLLFMVLTSNPFERLSPPPFEGNGLNPILQDPGLAFHPPFLYGGYVGFSLAFSFAIAALITGRLDAAWARWVRPWTLAAWSSLTLGIALGSYWAYYELGWGGWWFWDPVENASFMPWLAGTALLHSALVMEKREALKVWTVLLAILTFSLSLMGAFLVRSGVLTSVHAFAVDPERGVFILAIMIVFIGGSLALFAWRMQSLKQGGIFSPISREGSLVLNNVLLTTSCATVLIGTLYPLALEGVTGAKISVGPPYFDLTFGPLMVPLLLAMPFGPALAWKRGDLKAASERLWVAMVLTVIATVALYAMFWRAPWLAPFGLALGLWVLLAAIWELVARARVGELAWATSWRRFIGLPPSAFGTALGHAGVGIMTIGIVATTAYRVEEIKVMAPGDRISVAGYEIVFAGARLLDGPNYKAERADFTVETGSATYGLTPEQRRFTAPRQTTTEAGILATWLGDLYVVMGDKQSDGKSYSMRVYFNPLVRWIWIGALIMAIGGIFSLSDRRLRVGAPKRARALRSSKAQPSSGAVA
ncbi:MAG: heme lyase CcmF/NrfE family subunit [Pseudomonadota bacterium]